MNPYTYEMVKSYQENLLQIANKERQLRRTLKQKSWFRVPQLFVGQLRKLHSVL